MEDDIFDNSNLNEADEGSNDENRIVNDDEQEEALPSSAYNVLTDDGPIPTEQKSAKSDDASSISADLIRGHINTIILRALYERDKYGYEIMSDIEHKSHGQYSLKQPTLYSALKRLENQGYIKAYWKTDEVSSGGRRKYFTLTESGKEITEKNLAEWEYSRTIIDSLISDRSFDFSNPAPTPVDFTILRNSVSRVPVIKNEESESVNESTSDSSAYTLNEESTTYTEQIQSTQSKTEEIVSEERTTEPTTEQTYTEQILNQQEAAQTYTYDEQPVSRQEQETATSQSNVEQTESYSESAVSSSVAEDYARDDARRRAHENYMRLISEPVRAEQPVQEDIVPNSENVNTDSLIYNNRPETERDYKNLIDGIFKKAVTNGSVQTSYTRVEAKPVVEQPRHVRLVDRGRADGVVVTTSNNFDANSTYATKTTFNKGLTLLKCSSIVLAITAVEFIFCFIFLNQLATTWIYPTAILLLGLIQFVVFGIMALQGYGKNCVRPTTNGYISTCIILTIISILIISALAFILNINPTSASDVMKMIVIPSITALNVTVFALFFKLFLKK